MDTDRIVELLPHYVAMLILVFGLLTVIETAVGDLSFFEELIVIVAVVVLYRPVVIRLGVAPSSWTEREQREE